MNDSQNIYQLDFSPKRLPEHQAVINATSIILALDENLTEQQLQDPKMAAGLEYLMMRTLQLYQKFPNADKETIST